MSINKKRIEDSYDQQAETYQGSTGLAKLLLRDIKFPHNPSGLDIGCGNGVATFELYDLLGGQGRVIGVDISQKMIQKASQSGRALGYENVQFMKMDAESLEFADKTFDVVMSLFTYQFFPDKMKALKEMYRVLKPGGHLALFFTAGKSFMHESFEVFRMISEKHKEFRQFSNVLEEYVAMHITLEEFHEMLYIVGLTSIDVFGKHRIYWIDPRDYLEKHPYPIDLFSVIPAESREMMIREACDELARLSDPRGFKLTYYFIQALAKKPEAA
ncbi:MAG: methyltransferase domain-containing protein [Candidatus Bathyarchaeota archaeon]|nr:methyltransferase domain-containing protein [Candidatus Bathyarchaeota archaeon]